MIYYTVRITDIVRRKRLAPRCHPISSQQYTEKGHAMLAALRLAEEMQTGCTVYRVEAIGEYRMPAPTFHPAEDSE